MDDAAPVEFRRAAVGDARALANLGAETFVEAFGHLYPPEDLSDFLTRSQSEATYQRVLGDPAVAVWLAVPPAAPPMGFLVAGPCKLPVTGCPPAAGEIRQLYLRTAAQRQQLGTRLLRTGLEWLLDQGRKPIYVGVWSQNLGAQRLYARFGFVKVGEYDFPVGRQLDREFILELRG
ncbi:MAG: GNAT family N-acetyltransferase [Gammaproteobacteria bacterium]|nr:GNAT family N-acetyltransferase [Gammaproteobacteria bacterium]